MRTRRAQVPEPARRPVAWSFHFAWVAQTVEQRTRNAQVRSSSLLPGSTKAPTHSSDSQAPTKTEALHVELESLAHLVWFESEVI